jgi:shikimate kinase
VHDFSRADKANKMSRVLTPEGRFFRCKSIYEAASRDSAQPDARISPMRASERETMTDETSHTRRIVLTGFMGSGKSTVGPLLAARLGWRFVDVDDVIEAEAGAKIAELFTKHGEAAFREREHEAITRLAEGEHLVLALGGGAIETEENRTLLLESAGTLLVHLEVGLETTLKRCEGTEGTRPILADRTNLAARYERRLPLYRLAHVSIRVDGLTPGEAVEEVLQAAGFGWEPPVAS